MDQEEQFEAVRREIEALFRAARRRGAEHAAAIARELGFEDLARRFMDESREADAKEKNED